MITIGGKKTTLDEGRFTLENRSSHLGTARL
jgi:hypothetical protein